MAPWQEYRHRPFISLVILIVQLVLHLVLVAMNVDALPIHILLFIVANYLLQRRLFWNAPISELKRAALLCALLVMLPGLVLGIVMLVKWRAAAGWDVIGYAVLSLLGFFAAGGFLLHGLSLLILAAGIIERDPQ